jgi:hypothetical protein
MDSALAYGILAVLAGFSSGMTFGFGFLWRSRGETRNMIESFFMSGVCLLLAAGCLALSRVH